MEKEPEMTPAEKEKQELEDRRLVPIEEVWGTAE